MKFFSKAPQFDFMSPRRLAFAISLLVILVCLGSIVFRGLNLGVDFTGGTIIEVGYPEAADLNRIRSDLAAAGYGDAIIQHFGTSKDVLVRIAPRVDISNVDLSNDVIGVLNSGGGVEVRRVEFVGPQVGEELTEDGGLAMLFALIGILIYVILRFHWKFAIGAVAALVHDVLIVIGVVSLLGVEFNLTVLAAILAVIGYSLNDTIVVFDRVRENFRTMRKGTSVDIFNASLNQTLSRTLITGITTLLVLLALFFLGGEVIRGFALALIVGIVVGTYSSIYIAGNLALMLEVGRADFLLPEKEGANIDERP